MSAVVCFSVAPSRVSTSLRLRCSPPLFGHFCESVYGHLHPNARTLRFSVFTLFRVCVCFGASYSGVFRILSYWGCYSFQSPQHAVCEDDAGATTPLFPACVPRIIRFAVVAVCNRHRSLLWVGAVEVPAVAVVQEAKWKCVGADEVSLQEQCF